MGMMFISERRAFPNVGRKDRDRSPGGKVEMDESTWPEDGSP